MDVLNPLLELYGIKKHFTGTRALDWEYEQFLRLESGNVYALLGENGAGKSTLAKILAGIDSPTAGKIILNGKEFRPVNSKEAREAGIGIVLQEPGLISSLTVSENLLVGQEKQFSRFGFYSIKKQRKLARAMLEKVCPEMKPQWIVRDLLLEDQKMIEVARATAIWPQVLLIDETSAALSKKNVELLFSIMREACAQGTIVLFITHRMEEVFLMCNKAIVLKDGKLIAIRNTANTNLEELSRLMVGRTVDPLGIRKSRPVSRQSPILRVSNLVYADKYQNLSFDVMPGQIIGIGGLTGGGKEEVLPTIFGDLKATSGSFELLGQPMSQASPAKSIERGVAYVPRNREREGLILRHTIKANIMLASIKARAKYGFVNPGNDKHIAVKYAEMLSVKCNSVEDYVDSLSGGNRQKVVLARWMARHSRLLLLDNPTRGIDVGARVEIYRLMNELTLNGMGIVMVIDDLPELLTMSDEIYIIRKGEVSCHFGPDDNPTEHDVVRYMI